MLMLCSLYELLGTDSFALNGFHVKCPFSNLSSFLSKSSVSLSNMNIRYEGFALCVCGKTTPPRTRSRGASNNQQYQQASSKPQQESLILFYHILQQRRLIADWCNGVSPYLETLRRNSSNKYDPNQIFIRKVHSADAD
jgi:hypothetical protein